MQRVEIKLNRIIDNNLHFMNALDKSVYHPLIRKCKITPFPN